MQIVYISIILYLLHAMSLKVVSLFTGAGGLDIGLENAGFETVVCIENDADCRETLNFNRSSWGVVEEFNGDITQIPTGLIFEKTSLKKEDIALVVGGAPCQPFSNLGLKEGMANNEKGMLFVDYVRFIRDIKPRAFVFENVKGFIQDKHKAVLTYMVTELESLGYALSCKILNTVKYGVGQRRERFILIGILGNVKPLFPLYTHDASNFKTLGDVLIDIPDDAFLRDDCLVMNITPEVKKRMQYIKQGQNFTAVPPELLPRCWKNPKYKATDTFGRCDVNKPAPTIRTGAFNPSKGRYIHPLEHRGFNTIELAAIQDFPLSWKFKAKGKLSLVTVGRQIGNAVPPKLGEVLGKAILQQLYQ